MSAIRKIASLLAVVLLVSLAFHSAIVVAYEGSEGDGDESRTDEVPGPFKDLPRLVDKLLEITDDTSDTDGDGLQDSIEMIIGTDPERSDSDMDRLSDFDEAKGGTDPNNPDSNSDRMPDYFEVDNVPLDLDGDGVPNAWDWDNDGDGVSDSFDHSPFTHTNIRESFQLEIKNRGKPTYISFQLRPNNPDNLRLLNQVWDWPYDDQGRMKDLDYSRNDVTISPCLQFTGDNIPDSSSLEDYGVIVSDDIAFIPLLPVQEFGNIVALTGRMFYPGYSTPQDISAEVKLLWRVTGRTDKMVGEDVVSESTTLVLYYEDFMLTGFSVEEFDGSEAAVLSGSDMGSLLAAGLELDYRFLMNASNELSEIPGMLEGVDLTTDHRSFDHSDQAMKAMVGTMLKDAVDDLPKDMFLPVIMAMEDRSISIDLMDLASGKCEFVDALAVDTQMENVVTTRFMKTCWYETPSSDPLSLKEILDVFYSWEMDEADRATLVGFTLTWGEGRSLMVREGSTDVEFELPDSATWTSIMNNVTAYSINGLTGLTLIAQTTLTVLIRFDVKCVQSLVGVKDLLGIKSYWGVMKGVIKCDAGNIGKMNKLGARVGWLGFGIIVVTSFISFIAIGYSLGWTGIGTMLAITWLALTVLYAYALTWLAVSGGPIGAVISGIIALMDIITMLCGEETFGSRLINWIVESIYFYDEVTEVDMKFLGMKSEILDLDENGLDVGDVISFESDISGIVIRSEMPYYYYWNTPIWNSFIVPTHVISIAPDSGLVDTNTAEVEVVYDPIDWQTTSAIIMKKTIAYKTKASVSPTLPMVNYPCVLGLETSYKYAYEECWLIPHEFCDLEYEDGRIYSHWATLFLDVLPGSIDEFAKWRGITSDDFDGDGIKNGNESITSSWKWDTDGDGLGDAYELDIGSNPSKSDTDGDGLDDRFEHIEGLNISNMDTDGDGLSDYIEYSGWVVNFQYYDIDVYWKVSSNPAMTDTDGDGFNDFIECYGKTNPMSSDTNGDGDPDNPSDFYKTYFEFLHKFGDFDKEKKGDATEYEIPSGIAVHPDGDIYVVTRELKNRIQVYDPVNLTLIHTWEFDPDYSWISPGHSADPTGIALDNSGSVYIADDYVWLLDSSGSLEYQVCNYDDIFASDIAFGNDDRIYICDGEREKIGVCSKIPQYPLSTNWKWKTEAIWGGHGTSDGEFNNPYGIAVDDELYVYVADTGNNRIQKFKNDGTFITSWGRHGEGEGQFKNPEGICVDTNGDIIVTDTGNHRFQKFDSDGRFLASWGSWGYGPDQFRTPHAVAVGEDNTVYILDGTADSVVSYEPDGKIHKYGHWVELFEVEHTDAFTDTDGDGLPDTVEEEGWFTTVTSATSSIHQIDQPVTIKVTSNPLLADSDLDGVDDKTEYYLGSNPRALDTDGDGLSDAVEIEKSTRLDLGDSDKDGLDDGTELTFTSNPLDADTDGEGLSDYQEFLLGSHPLKKDSDMDGLEDDDEDAFGTNLTDPDSDDDFLFDGKEHELGTLPYVTDSDHDGIDDGYELIYNTLPTNGDSDGDGLLDGFEVSASMDPLSNDTDGDGVQDGDELERGLNPLSGDSDDDKVPDHLDQDWSIDIEEEIVLAYDDRDATSKFAEDLATRANVRVVSIDELFDDYMESRYIVLVGRPDAGEGTVGATIHDLLEDTGEVLEGMLESNVGRMVTMYGLWKEKQTVIFLSDPWPNDYARVLGVLKSMTVTVSDGTIAYEYHNPRACFQVDDITTVRTTDALVLAQLDEMATFNVELTQYNDATVPQIMDRTTGLEPGEISMGKFLNIVVSEDLQDSDGDIITEAYIQMYYTSNDLDRNGDGDAEDPEDMDEVSLFLTLYDPPSERWLKLTESIDWVISVGINKTNISLNGRVYEGYLWAATKHLCLLGIAGNIREALPTIAQAGDDIKSIQGSEIRFDGTASSGNGPIKDYRWTFEYNGTTMELQGPEPTFTFWEPGPYIVILEVKDHLGYTASDILVVDVEETPFEFTIGPIMDTKGKTIEGAKVKLKIGGHEFSNTTDADGIAHFQLYESMLGRGMTVWIESEGYQTVEYATEITEDFDLVQPPPPTIKESEPTSTDDEGVSLWRIVVVLVQLLALLLVAFMFISQSSIATRRREDELNGGEPEALSEEPILVEEYIDNGEDEDTDDIVIEEDNEADSSSEEGDAIDNHLGTLKDVSSEAEIIPDDAECGDRGSTHGSGSDSVGDGRNGRDD